MSDKVIQSYVYHGDQCFFVSTINRESSAVGSYGHMYAETMVWEYDGHLKKTCGPILGQGEGPKNSLLTHFEFCKQLSTTGEC